MLIWVIYFENKTIKPKVNRIELTSFYLQERDGNRHSEVPVRFAVRTGSWPCRVVHKPCNPKPFRLSFLFLHFFSATIFSLKNPTSHFLVLRRSMEEVCEGKEFSFPGHEEKILSFWSEIKAFETQLSRTESLPEYIFYDGPPFATGLPHYGHILAGTIKDIVTRYQTMRGHHVTRRFGWDCHGLPVENEIDRKLGIKRRDEVLKMGIDKYNEECRSIVTRYVEEWEKVITRTGRWIDFRNDYKTMDLKFMESVWWVFSQLYEKGLIYKGFKVSSSVIWASYWRLVLLYYDYSSSVFIFGSWYFVYKCMKSSNGLFLSIIGLWMLYYQVYSWI